MAMAMPCLAADAADFNEMTMRTMIAEIRQGGTEIVGYRHGVYYSVNGTTRSRAICMRLLEMFGVAAVRDMLMREA